jgi:Fe-S-cluster containining protein
MRLAADHVRRGGHAVVWQRPNRAHLLLPVPNEDDPTDLAYFSILDLGKLRYEIVKGGLARGLATTLVPKDCHGIVKRRIERDAVHAGATRRIKLDCLQCGACCYANRVVLDGDDLARFREAGREDLTRMPYARRSNGQLVLRLNRERACMQLRPDNCCRIYDVRPDMCRVFPVASECCLSARSEELGIVDGHSPS